jgi:hypothetical protein
LLLTIDLHKVFDLGSITVDPDRADCGFRADW